jgi:carbon-monoxide dehydrogenase large subunit
MNKHFKGRREDFRLVTGQGKYTSDWNFPNQTYGHFLRSDRAHARVVSVDASAALAMPGVLAVLTGEDTKAAGFKTAPQLVHYPGKGGSKIRVPHREVLAETRVRFIGQEVALVVAETAAIAQEASEAIVVEYEDLPALVDADDALAPGAVLLYDDIPGNLAFEYEYGDEQKTNEAFAGAVHVVSVTVDMPRIAGVPMEPKACSATYDPTTGVYDVYAPTQGMSMMVHSLSGGTGVAHDKVRVHALDVGGGFGVRSEGYTEYCSVMLAAKKVGRPVKWVGSRAETLVSDHHGRGAKMTGELALDKDGKFLGIRHRWTVNMGAYLSSAGALINTIAPAIHSVNIYTIPTVHGLHRLALGNVTPATAYRGAARPNVSYLVERLVDEAADRLGMDRVDIRRRNLITKDAFPYKNPFGAVYDSGDPVGLIDEVVQFSDWKGFEARRKESAARGKLRGISCCVFVEPAGGGGAPKEEVVIKFGATGEATLYTVSGPSGQGHETAFPEVVAEVLGVEAETLTLRAGDPDGPHLIGDGTIGSRSLMSHGTALHLTALEVVRKGKELASKALEAAEHDIEFDKGSYRVRGTDLSISIAEIARRYQTPDGNALDTKGEGPQGRAFPTGAHVCEVEIDPETGMIEIPVYVAVDDCGRVLNHTLVEGQMHGGIMQGLGEVISEECVYDASGQLLTGSFMDYAMPRADAIGDIRLYDHPVPTPNNPLGAKGAGEAGTTGSVPTIANAVMDALKPLGIRRLDMPYTPVKVWRAIESARAK